jgi:hypothetical protein
VKWKYAKVKAEPALVLSIPDKPTEDDDGLLTTSEIAMLKLSHAEALRMSMLRMIANSSKPEWAQPKFWAPFVVVGEPMKPPGSGDGIMPQFDISLIGRAGDAVIAGRAAPGATLELLRNGELHDRVVADQSGQFVMVPPGFLVGIMS